MLLEIQGGKITNKGLMDTLEALKVQDQLNNIQKDLRYSRPSKKQMSQLKPLW